MLAALVRFPLIFISGIFIPLAQMSPDARIVTYCSPLTYLVDGLNASMGQVSVVPVVIDALVLVAFTVVFLFAAIAVLKRKALKGL